MGLPPFEAIVETHHREIYAYLRRMRMHAAEDLSQETFLRAYRAYSSLTPDANVRAWLYTIATNLARNHIRGEKRRRAAYDLVRVRDADRTGEEPEGRARFNEARSRLEGVIDALPLKQRAAFIMRKFHDLPYEDIGRTLRCSKESARANVFQAYRKIHEHLQGARSTVAGGERLP